jgi:hypothetical protein
VALNENENEIRLTNNSSEGGSPSQRDMTSGLYENSEAGDSDETRNRKGKVTPRGYGGQVLPDNILSLDQKYSAIGGLESVDQLLEESLNNYQFKKYPDNGPKLGDPINRSDVNNKLMANRSGMTIHDLNIRLGEIINNSNSKYVDWDYSINGQNKIVVGGSANMNTENQNDGLFTGMKSFSAIDISPGLDDMETRNNLAISKTQKLVGKNILKKKTQKDRDFNVNINLNLQLLSSNMLKKNHPQNVITANEGNPFKMKKKSYGDIKAKNLNHESQITGTGTVSQALATLDKKKSGSVGNLKNLNPKKCQPKKSDTSRYNVSSQNSKLMGRKFSQEDYINYKCQRACDVKQHPKLMTTETNTVTSYEKSFYKNSDVNNMHIKKDYNVSQNFD